MKEYRSTNFQYKYCKYDNLGYFPGFYAASQNFDVKEFDFVIVCNVDLALDEVFFRELCAFDSEYTCILAPSIISKENGRDLNPKILSRPPRRKINFLYFMFKHPFLYRIYRKLSLGRAERAAQKIRTFDDGLSIYAPHGSFIIFGKSFFKSGGDINYPRFLFCEELYLGELTRKIGGKIRYSKTLKILDNEHGSTSKINAEFLSKHHVLSYKYILEHFFR
ncbi:hypothetical protein [Shewanella algae]|uniref:hypothetical protein n=1 Tax=Shewanella algae TaxID=38313 RepID=UPI001BF055B1|nr:hypothetical protein [Shewanella algae]BCV53199.1 hypothetical protein TUM17383_14460 [Shewanella algae]